ncbi:hypothetical protein [Streptomyces sp. NPDC047000]|uniref:hypothetical protein n=1 Tax=Streptomyces sp. NPDC047000 TaxID=3155474 RepID=UPI0034037991
MIPRRIVLSLVVGLTATLFLGACGSSDGTGSATAAPVAQPATSQPATSQPVASAPAASGSGRTARTAQTGPTAVVAARALKGIGTVVTDGNGMTLYRYDKDQPSPSKWTCAGACTTTWVPVIRQDSVRTSGVEASLLGTVHRNGMKQLTLAGWPLYRYVGDTGAGQVNGQGKDGEWHAVTPSGQKLATTG